MVTVNRFKRVYQSKIWLTFLKSVICMNYVSEKNNKVLKVSNIIRISNIHMGHTVLKKASFSVKKFHHLLSMGHP